MKKTFFTLWEDESFRKFIVNSKFMTKTHLTGNANLLVKWTMAQQLGFLTNDQLHILIKSSLHEASLASDAEKALSEDLFWQTLLKAASENSRFADIFEHRLQKITPVKQDQPPRGGGSGGGGPAA